MLHKVLEIRNKEIGGKKREENNRGDQGAAFWAFCCDPVADELSGMLLTNFRKSVNQEQVEGTGHTLSRCIYLCRAHEPQPLLYNIRGTLCVYLAWHHLKAAMHPPFCTLTAHPNMQPTAPSARSRVSSTQCLAKAGLSFFGDYPVPLKETRKQTGPGQRLHQAQPTTSAVEHQKCKSQNDRMRVRRVKDFCPCDSAEMGI